MQGICEPVPIDTRFERGKGKKHASPPKLKGTYRRTVLQKAFCYRIDVFCLSPDFPGLRSNSDLSADPFGIPARPSGVHERRADGISAVFHLCSCGVRPCTMCINIFTYECACAITRASYKRARPKVVRGASSSPRPSDVRDFWCGPGVRHAMIFRVECTNDGRWNCKKKISKFRRSIIVLSSYALRTRGRIIILPGVGGRACRLSNRIIL